MKEFQKMANDQLKAREAELRDELFKLRTGATTEKVKDTTRPGKIKKDIARIQTILRAQEMKKAQA
jgi:large subunit ribosomal protein L29